MVPILSVHVPGLIPNAFHGVESLRVHVMVMPSPTGRRTHMPTSASLHISPALQSSFEVQQSTICELTQTPSVQVSVVQGLLSLHPAALAQVGWQTGPSLTTPLRSPSMASLQICSGSSATSSLSASSYGPQVPVSESSGSNTSPVGIHPHP
ncbi:MAG: hypothetical protein UV82_C0001G0019 [Candidatus Magasanikbacteria bacterium GW2011_GWD2_43_18]|nr:MAG: hypothetical protein UV18_C0001G0062 [Candidatus Magasanikbacteria bacterium GW2011_GWC2_42_27]KKT05230.1 MAG: hypothetical protein UV82_C0001G0019 [Candidatus Magasanikbacteria bacterium GW2011_GWD2_43_18]KKT26148.1 MAG: hypothetical protein UW10_C0001G0062 [Candidatus Magasanikbacteria bacterium GW2011_GWA2_43_9]